MSNDSSKLLSRDEVLEGLGGRNAKRASTLLRLIETRTAYALANSRQAVKRYVPARPPEAQTQAFLQALAQGRDLPVQPTIREIERYAQRWAELVPDNPTLRAMTAHLLGQKYRFPWRATPGTRTALGLDNAAVQQVYQQIYDQPLRAIYSKQRSLGDRIKWAWARLAGRLENLSPFWSAFALTLTETVGAGILALPIALAQVGPLASVVLLVVFGLVNILTLAGVTEAIIRNGQMRFGYAFFGKLVQDCLGRAGTWAFSLALLLFFVLMSGSYAIGIVTTLASATGASPMLWAACTFLFIFYFLWRRSLDATIASALIIGFANLVLILILMALAWPHVQLEHLRHLNLPWLNGRPFDPKLIELIFGVVLAAYFGHTAVGNVAKVVLRRDPSGRTLLWGNIGALAVATVVYITWVLSVNGAIDPAVLAGTAGTALAPLAVSAGPAVYLFGSIFVVLGMGMALIQMSLGLFNQVQEWLPAPALPPTDKTSGIRFRLRWPRFGPRTRFTLGILPAVFIFIVVEWLLFTGQASFAGPLGLVGALVVPLLSGIFPVLLLAASRRKCEYLPSSSWRWLGHPLVLSLLYLLFFASVLAHGLVIWPDPLRRAIALVVCAGILVLTWRVLRRGALTPRIVVEVQIEPGSWGRRVFQIVSSGTALAVPVEINHNHKQQTLETAYGELPSLHTLRSLVFHLPATTARELKIWLHQRTITGESQGLAAHCRIHTAAAVQEYHTSAEHPALVLPVQGEPLKVEVSLLQEETHQDDL